MVKGQFFDSYNLPDTHTFIKFYKTELLEKLNSKRRHTKSVFKLDYQVKNT